MSAIYTIGKHIVLITLFITVSYFQPLQSFANGQNTQLPDQNLWLNFDPLIADFYATRGYEPIWINKEGPNQKARTLFTVITDSWLEGLYPDDYNATKIDTLWYRRSTESLSQLELLLTNSLLRYLADINIGRVNPCLLNPSLFSEVRSKTIDLRSLLIESVQSDDFERFLSSQLPAHEEYQLLRKALSDYRQLAATANWPKIAHGALIRPGKKDARIPAVRQRLMDSEQGEDSPNQEHSSLIYDEELQQKIIEFQRGFNLKPDGIIGQQTVKALNRTADELVKTILINMERWRWLPRTMASKQLLVNIAGFELLGFEHSQPTLKLPVIVGKEYHKTPVFNDAVRYIVFNPYWNIPNSIAIKKIVAEQKADPEYLAKNNMRIFSSWDKNAVEIAPESIDWNTIGRNIRQYRLRQDPGPDNSLGQIKFMFPNKHSVYLHDTPSKDLFEKHQRAFSHGCIRVGTPESLALFLLKDNNSPWTMENIDQQFRSNKRKVVSLNQPVNIQISYRTVSVDGDSGDITFYEDIYGRDKLLIDSFFTPNNDNICLYPEN